MRRNVAAIRSGFVACFVGVSLGLNACAGLSGSSEATDTFSAVEKVIDPDRREIDVYRYFGYNDAATSPIGRVAFQDFSTANGTVGGSWADPDAEFRAKSQSWVRPRISRRHGAPFLAVDFTREGHGANVRILPQEGTPMPLLPGSQLQFAMRSTDDACAGIRMQERDGEIWVYGNPPLDYKLFCPAKDGAWTTFKVDLDPEVGFYKFPYDGNHQLGNGTPELDLLVSISLELGFEQGDYLGTGHGRIDIRDFIVTQ